VLEGGQTEEDTKRKEIFFNETLAPDEINRLLDDKVLTNFKKFDVEGEHKVSEIQDDDNLIIKGNNLIALHSLKKKFASKLRAIYIDPPFNTGNDSFNYNDKFTRSSWLTFMKNRFQVAKGLLADDGNIFIHIDINQSHYMKILADDIFGEENFVEEIIWAYGSASGGRAAGTKPVNVHDYILHYAKNYSQRKAIKIFTPYSEKYINDWFKFDDNDGNGIYRRRHRGKDANGDSIWEKQYLKDSKGVPLTTVWSDINQIYANPQAYKEENKATSEIEKDFGNSGQKPEQLIQRILEMSTEEGDWVLDFFMGTGTTASAALKMKRKFITIEQMDSQISIGINRLADTINGKKSGISKQINWQGGGSFIYCELKNDAQDFKNRIFEADQEEVLKLFEEARNSSFLSYRVKPEISHKNEFKALSLAEQKQILSEIIDNNNLYVNYSDMEDEAYNISAEEKKLNKEFYGDL
jgi:adenine-specific DNA-methyltransferase